MSWKLKMNAFLVLSIIFTSFVIISCTDFSLNSILLEKKAEFVIKDKVVHSDNDDYKFVFMSNNSSDKWGFPVSGNYTITTNYSSSHQAIDIYAYDGYGSSILTSGSGVVVNVRGGCVRGNLSCNGRAGNYVTIKHDKDNYYTSYMHLSEIKVKVGDRVNAGDVIGSMGNTGNVVPVPTSSNPYLGTHLHFCLYKGDPNNGGISVNPLSIY